MQIQEKYYVYRNSVIHTYDVDKNILKQQCFGEHILQKLKKCQILTRRLYNILKV